MSCDDELFSAARWQCSQAKFDQQVNRIAEGLGYLVNGFPLFEIRALGERRLAGYFNDPLEAAQQAAFLDQYGYSLYFSLNPTSMGLAPIADRFNQMGRGKATKDEHTIRRRLSRSVSALHYKTLLVP